MEFWLKAPKYYTCNTSRVLQYPSGHPHFVPKSYKWMGNNWGKIGCVVTFFLQKAQKSCMIENHMQSLDYRAITTGRRCFVNQHCLLLKELNYEIH